MGRLSGGKRGESPARKRGKKSERKKFIHFRTFRGLFEKLAEERFSYFTSSIKHLYPRKFIEGDVGYFYKKRKSLTFRRFFDEHALYEMIKEELERLYPRYKHVKLALSRNGLCIYDNYRHKQFNVLLLTVHAGRWTPKRYQQRMAMTEKDRLMEEDFDSDRIYSGLVLEKGGIWINNKLSRFVCDYNRSKKGCIYFKDREKWLDKIVWKPGMLTQRDMSQIHEWHTEFYNTLERLLETYHFNIIFDGHTMKDKPGRPRMSFSTKYIPRFYMPIVMDMRKRMVKMGYSPFCLNKPYVGGFILKWLKEKHPHRFIFSMEVNKKDYMNKARTAVIDSKMLKLRGDIMRIFDLSEEQ